MELRAIAILALIHTLSKRGMHISREEAPLCYLMNTSLAHLCSGRSTASRQRCGLHLQPDSEV